ncbi:MAG: hypothetical protein Q9160_000479 [Pyrenula sp. 1 TL-2023]
MKANQNKLDFEETKLRGLQMPLFVSNPFENSVGDFWGILETRDYMRARYGLVEALMKVETREAAQAALSHLLDMIRLCRGDNMGVRDLTPGLMLRLGEDRQCYDFVLWWLADNQDPESDEDEDEDEDEEDEELPFFERKNEDMFEHNYIDNYRGRFLGLSYKAALMLIKIRLLLGLVALQKSSDIDKRLPNELFNRVRSDMVGSVVASRKDIMSSADQTGVINKLKTQILELYSSVKRYNKHFRPVLSNAAAHLKTRPYAYSLGGLEEAELVLQYLYKAWIETPGAISLIRGFVKARR